MTFFRSHIFLLLAALILSGGLVAAQDTRSQENKKAKLQKEIRQINEQLKDNKSKSRSEMQSLSLLKKKISTRTALISENEKEIASLSDSIQAASREISLLSARLDTLSNRYQKMVKTAYKNRDGRVWFLYLISSKSLPQGMRRLAYFKNISKEMNENATRLKETWSSLEAEKARLDSLSGEARERKKTIETEMNSLNKEKTQSEQMIAKLQKDKNKYTAQLAKKNKEVEALNREIAAIIRKAAAASSSSKTSSGNSKGTSSPKATSGTSGKTVSTDIDPALSGQFASNKGRLPWPVDGAVQESFGQNTHPVYSNIQLPYNNGVTLATRAGAPVKAVYDGEVTQVIMMQGYNQCVLVRHGQYFTLYCGLTGISVKRGDKVKTGQTLGSVATIDGEARMHFELWQDRTPQNPESWLK